MPGLFGMVQFHSLVNYLDRQEAMSCTVYNKQRLGDNYLRLQEQLVMLSTEFEEIRNSEY